MLPFPHKSLWMHLSVYPVKVIDHKCRWNDENCKETIVNWWCSPKGEKQTNKQQNKDIFWIYYMEILCWKVTLICTCADLLLMLFNLVNEHTGQKNKWKDKLLPASSILPLRKLVTFKELSSALILTKEENLGEVEVSGKIAMEISRAPISLSLIFLRQRFPCVSTTIFIFFFLTKWKAIMHGHIHIRKIETTSFCHDLCVQSWKFCLHCFFISFMPTLSKTQELHTTAYSTAFSQYHSGAHGLSVLFLILIQMCLLSTRLLQKGFSLSKALSVC